MHEQEVQRKGLLVRLGELEEAEASSRPDADANVWVILKIASRMHLLAISN